MTAQESIEQKGKSEISVENSCPHHSRLHAQFLKVFPGFRVRWINLQRFAVIRYRTIAIALSLESDAAVVVGFGVFRIDLDRLGVVGDGAVVLLLLAVSIAAVVVGDRVLRILPNAFGTSLDGDLATSLVAILFRIPQRCCRTKQQQQRQAHSSQHVCLPRKLVYNNKSTEDPVSRSGAWSRGRQ